MNHAALARQLLPEILLGATALLILGVTLAGVSRRRREPSAGLTQFLSLGGVLLAGAAMAFAPPEPMAPSAMLSSGPLVLGFKGLVLLLAFTALLLPPARREFAQPGEFHTLVLFALTGLLLAIGSSHLLLLFVALELSSLSLYLLAGFSRGATATEASLKYFLFGAVSAAFFLFGASLLYGFTPDLSFTGLSNALNAGPLPPFAAAGLLMVLAAFAFKLAAAPFHFWAPDVYQGAPATSVAIIAAASKAAGAVILARLLFTVFDAAAGSAAWGAMRHGWAPVLAVLAALSMLAGNLLALVQTSVRRLLAYSAVANTGYILVGFSANGAQAAASSLFYVVIYGLATVGALAVTAAVERDRGTDSAAAFSGLVHRSPGQALALLVCIASLAGIPPLAGFTGKFAIFCSVLAAQPGAEAPGLIWLVAIGALTSAISLYYYLLVLKPSFVHGVRGEPDPPDSTGAGVSLSHALGMGIPAFALIVFGIQPALLLSPITTAISLALGVR